MPWPSCAPASWKDPRSLSRRSDGAGRSDRTGCVRPRGALVTEEAHRSVQELPETKTERRQDECSDDQQSEHQKQVQKNAPLPVPSESQ
jgi:hypothetical protein